MEIGWPQPSSPGPFGLSWLNQELQNLLADRYAPTAAIDMGSLTGKVGGISLIKKAMTEATSSGPPRRLIIHDLMGDCSSSCLRLAGLGWLPKCISVTIQPGATALTRIP